MAKKTTEDPRPQKLRGIFLLFLSLYLCIAFTSYLFTWENDSDLVNRFSLDLLVSDKHMENWLGRLGAIVSNLLLVIRIAIVCYRVPVVPVRHRYRQ